jgi:hypothetical protein
MRAFGIPLRTTETEINVVEPSTPDIRVGRVFDRNWELLSPLLPVWMITAAVHRRFTHTIAYLVYQNLAGSARSGRRASMARWKPGGAWMS